jgi:hypothetical protein
VDVFGSVADLRQEWNTFFEDAAPAITGPDGEGGLHDEVFEATLERLAEQGDLVFVYDRQRARSRVFETVHYLRQLRQRLMSHNSIDESPPLVEMVKAETVRRQRPVRDVGIDDVIAAIEDVLYAERTLPIAEGIEDFEGLALEVLEVFRDFLIRAFGRDARFAGFQHRATGLLVGAGLANEGTPGAVAITAGTGFGKTEAFVLPLIYYAALARVAGARRARHGVAAVLLYPRRDLCDDQAARLAGYLLHLNDALRIRWPDLAGGVPFRPLRVALAHSAQTMKVGCPLCQDERRANSSTWAPHDEQEAWLVAEPGNGGDFAGPFRCRRRAAEHQRAAETLVYQVNSRGEDADLVVTTLDTLHRRLMDAHGRARLFGASLVGPRFLVLDEMHIYEGQSGAHGANIIRRARQRIRAMRSSDEAVIVGASATIADPADLLARMSGVDRERIRVEQPGDEETTSHGMEYFLFLQSPGNRLIGDDNEDVLAESVAAPPRRFVSEQATMIQAAMCLQHTMKSPAGPSPRKRRVLGFVDSLDVAARLGRNLDDAEWQKAGPGGSDVMAKAPLYTLRLPAGRPDAATALQPAILAAAREIRPAEAPPALQFREPGRDCPRFRERDCRQPPHHLLAPCPRYEKGECWYAMAGAHEEGLRPLIIQTHRSGRRAWAFPGRRCDEVADRDTWRLLVTTSALEVGFDHRELIATWQYHAPPSVVGFLQRKGRGGRDLGDYPITMMVLGTSAADVFAFQHHGRYVVRSDRELTCWVDPDNPSMRTQHMVAAIFDFCAANISQRAYSVLDFILLSDAVRDRRPAMISWLRACFPTVPDREIADTIDRVARAIRDSWSARLALPERLGWPESTRVATFESRTAEEMRAVAALLDNAPASREAQIWLLSLARGRTTEYPTAPDFFAAIPDEAMDDPDLRVPAGTLSEPLGRKVRLMDSEQRTEIGADPAEFALNCFLPGGFKIRYEGNLWMAPWEAPVGWQVPAGTNRTWAAIVVEEPDVVVRPPHPHLETGRQRQPLAAFLSGETDLAPERQAELLALLGSDATLASVAALHLQRLGRPAQRSFVLDEATLRIVSTRGEASPLQTRLIRDPHLSAQRVIVPLRPRKTEAAAVAPAPFRRMRFHREQRFAILHYANLVHCYPADAGERTVVVRFCAADTPERAFCPGVMARSEAIELVPDATAAPSFDATLSTRAYWRRVRERLAEVLVVRTGVLQSAYLVDNCVDALAALEPDSGAFRTSPPGAGALGALITESAAWLTDLHELAPHAALVSEVLEEASRWASGPGIGRAFADTVAAALVRAGAETLNLAPNVFRRLVEPFGDGWRILIYDDNEGGSGNSRRLWETLTGWSDVRSRIAAVGNCPIAAADNVTAQLLGSGHSADALAILRTAGRLGEVLADTPEPALMLRLERLLDDADIAAFNLYGFGEFTRLQEQYGGLPPLTRFEQHVRRTLALDPRAELLRRRFMERHGRLSDLPSRLRGVMPLCEAACSYCVGDEDYADRRLLGAL